MRVAPPGGTISSRTRGWDGPVFHPNQLANLHGWYDATQETYANAAAVTGLTDRAPSPHNLSQATGANQPTFQTSGINTRAAVSFDGVNDTVATATNAFTNFTTCTVCCAVRTGAVVSGGPYNILNGVNAAVNAQVTFGVFNSLAILQGTALAVGGAIATSTNYRLIYVYNGASSAIYINGTATSGINAGATNIASYRLGSDNSIGGPWNGLQGEVISYNRVLAASEIALVDLYLSRKWGI